MKARRFTCHQWWRYLFVFGLTSMFILLVLNLPSYDTENKPLQDTHSHVSRKYSDRPRKDYVTLAPLYKHKQLSEVTNKQSTRSVIVHQKRKPVPKNAKFYKDSATLALFDDFEANKATDCDGDFIGYDNEFAVVRNVTINREFCRSRNAGGEALDDVINQAEEEEFFTFSNGCFRLSSRCRRRPLYYFEPPQNGRSHLNSWLEATTAYGSNGKVAAAQGKASFNGVTVAVTRYEYANLYHTMSDWYNVFLVTQFLRVDHTTVRILFVDAHPKGKLDVTWNTLFNSSIRLGHLPNVTTFSTMIWSIIGYNGMLSQLNRKRIPLVEGFKEFFLDRHGIQANKHLDCKKLNILLIVRRDYLAHPRNPTGSISRRFENEDEMVRALRLRFGRHTVTALQLDTYNMHEQLHYVTSTDIMIGMHGAGLSHVLFLPRHAGVIELLPGVFMAENDHFQAMARWRNLHYAKWINNKLENEITEYETKVAPDKLVSIVEMMIKDVCSSKRKASKTRFMFSELLQYPDESE